MFAEYPAHDGIGLAELIRRDEVSAGEVLQAALARLEQLNPRLNAVTLPMADYAHAQLRDGLPDGPFRGVPVLLKDLLSACAGVPTRSGNRLLKNRAPPAQADSALIARLRASGVVFIGKTNTAELGLTPYTEPAAFGPTHNPARHGFSAGGSSGGSAAAVAAGIVPIATGGDGGGSLRIPASCCGVFAMKPTRGRTPTAPAGEHWGGLAIEHVLTRSVRDSAAMLDVLAGPEPGAPYAAPPAPASWRAVIEQPPPRLRIAFSAKPLLGRTMHADCVAGLNATVSLLRGLGHELEEAHPAFDADAVRADYVACVAAHARADIEAIGEVAGMRVRARDFEPSTWAIGLLGRAFSASELAQARKRLQQASRQIAEFFVRHDVFVTPTVATPPPRIGALQPSALEQRQLQLLGAIGSPALVRRSGLHEILGSEIFEFIPITPLANISGQPAMSVPLCRSGDDLPVGMHFEAAFGRDDLLLQLARQLEQARPW